MIEFQRGMLRNLCAFGFCVDVATIIYQYSEFSGSIRETLGGHTHVISCLTVFPNGDLCSGSYDETIKIWRDGKCIYTLVGHNGWINCLAIGNDGNLYSGSIDKTIKVWKDGICIRTLNDHEGGVDCLAFLNNGKSVQWILR